MNPTDYIRGSNGNGEAVRAIIVEEREIGDMSIITDSVLNYPNKFVATSGTLDEVTGLIDEDTMCIFLAHLDGSIIMIEEFAPGYSDVGHTVGQVILLKPSTEWANLVAQAVESAASVDYVDEKTQVALVKNEIIGGTKNGVNTVFTLASEAVTGTVELYKNGVRQAPGAGNDYTVAGQTITMAVAPLAGTVLLADYATSTSQFTSGVTGFVTNQTPTGLVNSSNKIYTCANSYIPGTLEVWINGLKQIPVTHYVETTPASGVFTMGDAPLTADNILVNYQHTLAAGIGSADLVDGFHASAIATAGTLLALDGSGKYPTTTVSGLVTPDAGWITPTLLNGWVRYAVDYYDAGYRIDASGYVHLRGMLKNGSSTFFVLPVGYRPAVDGVAHYLLTASASGGLGRVDIFSDGSVNYVSGGNAWFSLDGITFKAGA